MKVLVVDDSAVPRIVLKKTLASLGIDDVVEAVDGQDALEKYKAGSFDIIFSDWNMPNMNGLEFLIAVRALDAHIPFVMITTEGTRGKVTEAIANGVTDYLVKPFTPAKLTDKVTKWVSEAV